MSAEIVKTLDTIGFDKEALKQKMLTCVSEKYKCLGTGSDHGAEPKRYIQIHHR